MKIANPWPYHAMSRCICKPGDQVCVQASRGPELEIPDGSIEAMIEPIRQTGRGGKVEVIGPGRIWSKAWGLLDVEDHLKKMKMAEEEAALAVRVEADKLKRQEEAKARAEKVRSEKAKPAPKPAPMPAPMPESDGPDMAEWANKANAKKEQK